MATTSRNRKKVGSEQSGAGTRRRPSAASKRVRRAARQPAPEDIDEEALEFIAALTEYKKRHDRPFPSWSEVLHVLKSLGYEKRA